MNLIFSFKNILFLFIFGCWPKNLANAPKIVFPRLRGPGTLRSYTYAYDVQQLSTYH